MQALALKKEKSMKRFLFNWALFIVILEGIFILEQNKALSTVEGQVLLIILSAVASFCYVVLH